MMNVFAYIGIAVSLLVLGVAIAVSISVYRDRQRAKRGELSSIEKSIIGAFWK